MYNKIVITLLALAMAGTVHAQYYSSNYYVPTSYGYANSQYIGPSAAAGLSYYSQRYMELPLPTPKTPSSFSGAYQPFSFAPVFGPSRSLPPMAFDVRQSNYMPSFGPSPVVQPIALNMGPGFTPSYGHPISLGSASLALQPRQIPDLGSPFSLDAYRYGFADYAAPVYATPSRALFNTEVGFGTYWNPYA